MKEEWRTIVVNGKEHPWYSVSNLGNVRSHLRQGRGNRYNPHSHRDLTPYKATKQRGYIGALTFNIYFPDDFFEDYQYKKVRTKDPNVVKICTGHELVMGAFRPMDDFPPDRLKDCWEYIPEEAKKWIKESPIINHKNHDPSDNHVDNLEYVTQRENTRAAVKYYGGNMNNKNKNKEDDWLKITDPAFNPLLQEYEDGEIEFIGPEGEKYYKMLENIARDSGKPINEIYVSAIKRFYDKMKKEEGEIK
tara:strand:+ start:54 stop:797 length:744 start_codon:yes stop_codon:yes gene_type:complete